MTRLGRRCGDWAAALPQPGSTHALQRIDPLPTIMTPPSVPTAIAEALDKYPEADATSVLRLWAVMLAGPEQASAGDIASGALGALSIKSTAAAARCLRALRAQGMAEEAARAGHRIFYRAVLPQDDVGPTRLGWRCGTGPPRFSEPGRMYALERIDAPGEAITPANPEAFNSSVHLAKPSPPPPSSLPSMGRCPHRPHPNAVVNRIAGLVAAERGLTLPTACPRSCRCRTGHRRHWPSSCQPPT
ncbi:hypothetical protein ACQEVZ_60475 [Dactylosporangium sp. CA-152071]|uniref:hypothetical protein n=1 Tax=Dactylosporangium sp. CA-152071 TaxID=3239933 RepID=UPI003D8F8ADA